MSPGFGTLPPIGQVRFQLKCGRRRSSNDPSSGVEDGDDDAASQLCYETLHGQEPLGQKVERRKMPPQFMLGCKTEDVELAASL